METTYRKPREENGDCLRNYMQTQIFSKSKMLDTILLCSHTQSPAILAWGSANQESLKRLNVLHRRAVRLMTLHGPLQNFFKYSHDETLGNIKNIELFKSCDFLQINEIYELELAKLMHKVANNNVPNALNNIFQRPRETQHLTRGASNREFIIPYIQTLIGEKMLSYQGPKLWQNIDPLLKANSYKTFAKNYKKAILEKHS